ncbi:MAG: VCBS repeat-containing protein, partial [Planctomycetota bacterium]
DFVYHDANDGGGNLMFRNDSTPGKWNFVDATAEVGLDANNQRHSLAASWADFDNDGDADLYVANDYGQNCLYRNDGGRFTDIAPEAGVVDFGSGMSVSWGDVDRDGQLDLYVGNMFSSAGNRITRQRQFKPDDDGTTREVYRRFAKGNSLFQNDHGVFKEFSGDAGVEMARWAWSSLFADLNNDGWQDLVVANGYITTEDTGDL